MRTPEFAERLELHREALVAHLRELGPLYLMTHLYGTTSDELVWDGSRELLSSGGLEFEELEMWRVSDVSHRDGTLVVPGSGAFHEYWHEWLPAVVAEASDTFDLVVVLPSSYDTSVAEVAEILARTNVQFLAREPASYRAVSEIGPTGLSYDPALFSRSYPDLPSMPGGPELVALRTDVGSRLTGFGWAINETRNNDISVTSASLDEFMARVASAGSVVTDRLHVAVAAAMSGRPVRYLDPYDRMISSYLDYVFRGELGELVAPISAEWLADRGLVTAA